AVARRQRSDGVAQLQRARIDRAERVIGTDIAAELHDVVSARGGYAVAERAEDPLFLLRCVAADEDDELLLRSVRPRRRRWRALDGAKGGERRTEGRTRVHRTERRVLVRQCDGRQGRKGDPRQQRRADQRSPPHRRTCQQGLGRWRRGAATGTGVPAFELTPLEGAGSPRAYRLKVSGSSTLNPDGTASYRGLKGLEPGGRTVRAIDLIDEAARVVTFTVALERDVCPFVAAKVYQYGKSPRAQIALTFGGASALTIETISDAVGGAPIGTTVKVSGAGYEPSSNIRITI